MQTIHFDVTRLFVRGSRFSPTGIDRVVMAYAAWLLSHPDVRLEPVLTVGGILLHLRREVLAQIIAGARLFSRRDEARDDPNWAALVAILGAPSNPSAPLRAPRLRHQISTRARWYMGVAMRSLAQLRPVAAERGSLYLNVSHTGLGDPGVLGRVAASGATPVVMIHDLIPIHHPEYCSPQAEARHLRRMRQVVDHAGHVITNSRTTAEAFVEYARAGGDSAPPVSAIPLGIQPEFLTAQEPLLAARPYFVCVGTIEARKNLAFLLALWRQLDERLGDRAPRLVLVGRRGWENEAVIDHLDRSKAVLRLVDEVCDLRDRDLARLVAGATSLISPSFTEGFDLPVLEALAARTPVIASRIPVHEEFAGGVATLVEPHDGPAWLAALEAAAVERTLGPPVVSPTWEDHFNQVAPVLGLRPWKTAAA
jgi:glycosyltransferase involved in cell wall biosynthesis